MAIGQGSLGYTSTRTWSKSAARSDSRWHLLTAVLIAADAAALGLAFALAYLIRFKTGIPLLETPPHSLAFYTWVAFLGVPAWLGLFGLCHLYDRRQLFAGFQEYTSIAHACTAGTLAVIVISFLDTSLFISRGWLLLVWAVSLLAVGSSRFATRRLVRWLRTRGSLTVPTVVVGANEEGLALAEQLLSDPGSGARVIGFVDNSASPGARLVGDVPVLGRVADVEEVVYSRGVREVIVATTALTRGEFLDLYRAIGQDPGVEFRLSSGLFEILTTGVRVQEISCVPLMTPERVRITGVDALVKTALDYFCGACGLVALSPLLVAIGLLVRLTSPGPVLHRRRVLGTGGKPFDALKFRTMVANADEVLKADPRLREAFEKGYKLRSDPRVTPVGRFLRRTSLDELPQLINVLRGEMSLVGPRMIAPEEAPRYGKWELNLLTVKPGITGPWQVHGRSDISYDERIRLSMHYIRNYSIWLDLEILLRTVSVVLLGKGAY